MKIRLLAVTAALTAAATAPAHAAEIRSEAECVRLIPGQQTLALTGTGFTPDDYVTFTADGQTLAGSYADASGNVAGLYYPPSFSSFERMQQTFTIAASDTTGVVAPAITVPMSRIAVKAPDRAKPRKKVRFRVFGFAAGQPVFLHLRRDGKTKRSLRLGVTKGICGNLVKKLRYLPLKRWSTGTYEYHFSHAKKWSEETTVYILRIAFFRTFG